MEPKCSSCGAVMILDLEYQGFKSMQLNSREGGYAIFKCTSLFCQARELYMLSEVEHPGEISSWCSRGMHDACLERGQKRKMNPFLTNRDETACLCTCTGHLRRQSRLTRLG